MTYRKVQCIYLQAGIVFNIHVNVHVSILKFKKVPIPPIPAFW
jgi:hypothetical protein